MCRHQINQSLCDGSMVLEDFDLGGLGAALLRFILAGFWIAHWWYKVGYRGMPATQAFFFQQGLPGSHGSMSASRSLWRCVSFSASMYRSYA
jgi:uncharacterized membrane protein YphA (DoxX/SURF4 family)